MKALVCSYHGVQLGRNIVSTTCATLRPAGGNLGRRVKTHCIWHGVKVAVSGTAPRSPSGSTQWSYQRTVRARYSPITEHDLTDSENGTSGNHTALSELEVFRFYEKNPDSGDGLDTGDQLPDDDEPRNVPTIGRHPPALCNTSQLHLVHPVRVQENDTQRESAGYRI